MSPRLAPALLVALSTAHADPADTRRHELRLNLGTLSSQYLMRGAGFNLSDYLDDKWHGGPDHSAAYTMRNTGVLSAGYSYRIGERWWLTLDHTAQDFKDDQDSGRIRALLVGARREHQVAGNTATYSGLALGRSEHSYRSGRDKGNHGAYQIDAVGLRFGKGTVSGQVALGYGFAGMLQAGVNARF